LTILRNFRCERRHI